MDGYNLASQLAGSSVCSSAVSLADCPLSNILAGLPWMADTFIKPPVSVTVHLPLPVRLARLEWSCRVGGQSSLCHEVLVITDTAALARGRGCQCSRQAFNMFKVGSGQAGSDGRMVFTNRRLSPGREGLRLHSRENYSALHRVTAVVIRITRTASSSVPCLAQLKVFGCSSGEPQYRQLEERLVRDLQSPAEAGSSRGTFSYFGGDQTQHTARHHTGGEERDQETGDCEETGDVPVEFLDSITHGLMSLPMTLPSGHLVDRTTVERCEEMFRARGGQPRDPFTGKLFSQSYKPCFNAALKSRIDRFVLTRRELRSEGQTLGDAESIQRFLSLNTSPSSIGEKRKLDCDNAVSSEPPQVTSSTSDHEESDEDVDNTDLSQALQRSLSKRKRIIKS